MTEVLSYISSDQMICDNCRKQIKRDVLCDFAENYLFVLQNEVQGFHWNNAQATIQPFAIYYRQTETEDLSYTNLVVISDCLQHNTVAVHTFQKCLVHFLKQNVENVCKLYYFSDGCAGQYKNRKNFSNLVSHKADFGIPAEWHFFATSHGKNSCDGLGGTVKRLAARASLQRIYTEQIMTPWQLFDWAKGHIKNMNFVYVSQDEILENEKLLHRWHEEAMRVPGTQALRAFIPGVRNNLIMKRFSADVPRNCRQVFHAKHYLWMK